jgi:hypothetical protein
VGGLGFGGRGSRLRTRFPSPLSVVLLWRFAALSPSFHAARIWTGWRDLVGNTLAQSADAAVANSPEDAREERCWSDRLNEYQIPDREWPRPEGSAPSADSGHSVLIGVGIGVGTRIRIIRRVDGVRRLAGGEIVDIDRRFIRRVVVE